MSGYTIEGIIKRENFHDMNKETLTILMEIYNIENNSKVPIAGTSVKIPIIKKADLTSA